MLSLSLTFDLLFGPFQDSYRCGKGKDLKKSVIVPAPYRYLRGSFAHSKNPRLEYVCLFLATLIENPDMGSSQNKVHYCCVSRNNQILYAYNNGEDQCHESLAALCLEKTPPFHKWYFETLSERTFGFLMEDGFVYFAVVDKVFKSSSVLDFLEQLRDELRKANKKNSRGSFSGSISFSNVQDQLVRGLIASLERVAETDLNCLPLSSPSIDGVEQSDAANSTNAPLLGRFNKQEKRKGRDHVVNIMKGIELEEQQKSTDAECSTASSSAATYVPRRGRSGGSQSIERKWRRQVKIVLVIDAAICLTLLGVWLAICQGLECTRS